MWRPPISSDELWHHGILGQKWGDQNGPPYPLDSGEHSSKEKSRGWKESLHQKDTAKRHKELAKKYKPERKIMASWRERHKMKKTAKYKEHKKDIKAFSKMSPEEFQKEYDRRNKAATQFMRESFSKSKNKGEYIARQELADQAMKDFAKMYLYKKQLEQMRAGK